MTGKMRFNCGTNYRPIYPRLSVITSSTWLSCNNDDLVVGQPGTAPFKDQKNLVITIAADITGQKMASMAQSRDELNRCLS